MLKKWMTYAALLLAIAVGVVTPTTAKDLRDSTFTVLSDADGDGIFSDSENGDETPFTPFSMDTGVEDDVLNISDVKADVEAQIESFKKEVFGENMTADGTGGLDELLRSDVTEKTDDVLKEIFGDDMVADGSGGLQELVATNSTNVGANASGIAANSANISDNADDITANDRDISTNATNIATNDRGISTNATNIATNDRDISTNATNIATNDRDISTNATNIATNDRGISTNATNIATNDRGIAANAVSITANTSLANDALTRANSAWSYANDNKSLINQNTSNIAGNASLIASNNSDIATNAASISINASNISVNSRVSTANLDKIYANDRDIATNAGNIRANESSIIAIEPPDLTNYATKTFVKQEDAAVLTATKPTPLDEEIYRYFSQYLAQHNDWQNQTGDPIKIKSPAFTNQKYESSSFTIPGDWGVRVYVRSYATILNGDDVRMFHHFHENIGSQDVTFTNYHSGNGGDSNTLYKRVGNGSEVQFARLGSDASHNSGTYHGFIATVERITQLKYDPYRLALGLEPIH